MVADTNATEELSVAYEKVKEIDALDITDDGQEIWDGATRRYDERIERVEARKTDEEKFGVTRETAKQYRQEALNLYEKRLRQQQLIPSIICEEYL